MSIWLFFIILGIIILGFVLIQTIQVSIPNRSRTKGLVLATVVAVVLLIFGHYGSWDIIGIVSQIRGDLDGVTKCGSGVTGEVKKLQDSVEELKNRKPAKGDPGKDGVCKKCEHQKTAITKVVVETKTALKSTTTSVTPPPKKTGPVEVVLPQSNEPPDPPETDTTGGEKGAVQAAPSRTREVQVNDGPGDPPERYDEGQRPLRHPPLHPVEPSTPAKRDKNGRPNGMFGDYRGGDFWSRQQRRF